ncbi:hypothetical protein H632_c2099p0, partial [Helicosporidium sp. ATCC 50920]
SSYETGNLVSVAYRVQVGTNRSHWEDLVGAHCATFKAASVVDIPIALASPPSPLPELKIQFSVDGDRLITPWITVLGRGAPLPPAVDLLLVAQGGEVARLEARARDLPSADVASHPQLSMDWREQGRWPKHLVVSYHWRVWNRIDEGRAINWALLVGIAFFVVSAARAVASYKQQLALFWDEIAGQTTAKKD